MTEQKISPVVEYRMAEGCTVYRRNGSGDFIHCLQADTYGLLLCTKGALEAITEGIACHLNACSLLVLFPRERIFFQFEADSSFIYFVLEDSYLAKEYDKYRMDTLLDMRYLHENGVMEWEAEDGKVYERMFECAIYCVTRERDGWRRGATSAAVSMLLCTLFARIGECVKNSPLNENDASWRNVKIVTDFMQCLSKHFKRERSVSFYASCLCVTPKHLSTSIKLVTGISARAWIDNMVVEEICRLLLRSEFTIKEITFRMNFSSVSFMGKYFKKCKGVPPKEYRNKFFSKQVSR